MSGKDLKRKDRYRQNLSYQWPNHNLAPKGKSNLKRKKAKYQEKTMISIGTVKKSKMRR